MPLVADTEEKMFVTFADWELAADVENASENLKIFGLKFTQRARKKIVILSRVLTQLERRKRGTAKKRVKQ